MVRALLQKYSRSFFRIETCKKQCLLINKFTKTNELDSADDNDSIRPTLLQKIYYGKLRSIFYLCASAGCLVLSLGIIAGEFLIFQGISIQPVFKRCLESMDYISYLVLAIHLAYVLDSFLVHDHLHLSYSFRTGARRLLWSLQAPHG